MTRTQAQGTQRLISLRRDDLDERAPGLIDVLTSYRAATAKCERAVTAPA